MDEGDVKTAPKTASSQASAPALPPPMPGWQRAPYRLGQFLRGLTATVGDEDRQFLSRWLSSDALVFFDRLPVDAQRHSLNVAQTLLNAGFSQLDLTAAALLHDVGKAAADDAGVRLQLWLRGPIVLAEWLTPDLLVSQAAEDPTQGWRYALHVQLDHPAIGAAWAREAGCSDLTCWLIEHHQDKTLPPPGERRTLLAALQWADERN